MVQISKTTHMCARGLARERFRRPVPFNTEATWRPHVQSDDWREAKCILSTTQLEARDADPRDTSAMMAFDSFWSLVSSTEAVTTSMIT